MAYYFDHPDEIHRALEEEVGQSAPTEPSTLRLKLQRAKENRPSLGLSFTFIHTLDETIR